MMTRQEELRRAIEDRDMLETDIDLMNDELRYLDEESEKFEDLESEINNMQNQVYYLNHVIEDLQDV